MEWNTDRKYPKLNSGVTVGRFKGYVALVTGGCSGIGRATVERLANDGATVYALDIHLGIRPNRQWELSVHISIRRQPSSTDVNRQLTLPVGPDAQANVCVIYSVRGEKEMQDTYGERVSCVELDVTDSERCHSVVADIASKHHSIHTLVNGAAYFGSKALTAKRDDWTKSFDVNVIGYSTMVQAVVPFMNKGEGCSIVNLSSISGLRAQPNRWTYAATKGAISSITQCMALDLREKDIRVNAVSPSWVWSPEVAKAANYDRAGAEEKWGKFFILNRLADVEEVAAVIAFLASKDAAYITGSDIPVCGGYLAIGPEQLGENSSFSGCDY